MSNQMKHTSARRTHPSHARITRWVSKICKGVFIVGGRFALACVFTNAHGPNSGANLPPLLTITLSIEYTMSNNDLERFPIISMI
jgi:hypothetical protein